MDHSGLNSKPGSSSPRQRSTLAIEAKKRGMDISELRDLVGGSVSKLSAAEASDWIKRISDRDLPNDPGGKKSSYKGKPHAARIITNEHVEQIVHLLTKNFKGELFDGLGWLQRNFKVGHPRDLLTARRAGEVIRVLKTMLSRRKSSE